MNPLLGQILALIAAHRAAILADTWSIFRPFVRAKLAAFEARLSPDLQVALDPPSISAVLPNMVLAPLRSPV